MNRFLNALEAMGGSSWLAHNTGPKDISCWNEPLSALIIAIRQVGLSGWKSEECDAIQNELLAWQQKGYSETQGKFVSLYHFIFIIGLNLLGSCPLLRTLIALHFCFSGSFIFMQAMRVANISGL